MRHRTAFRDDSNYTGWWVKSKTGDVYQIIKKGGTNIRMQTEYILQFASGQIGNGIWTIQSLRQNGAWITREKPTATIAEKAVS